MPDILKGNRDALPDHATPAGDALAWSYTIRAEAPDGSVARSIRIAIYGSGALGVDGDIGDRPAALAMIEHAKDLVNGYNPSAARGVAVPGRDVSIPGVEVKRLVIVGPLGDRLYALAVLAAARTALDDYHLRAGLIAPSMAGTAIEL